MRFRQVLLHPLPDNNVYACQFIVWLGNEMGTTKKGGAWTYEMSNEKTAFKLELVI